MLRLSFAGSPLLLCGVLCTLVSVGCSPTPRPPPSPLADVCAESGPEREVLYYRDVKPVLEARCSGCHQEGGAAPFALTEPQQVVAMKSPILQSVCARTMPPWSPHPACNEYQHDRSLTDEQIALIRDWVRAGAPLGAPEDAPPPVTPRTGLSRVDLELPMPEPYVPQQGPDDYRCFLIDWPRSEESFISGIGVVPGQTSIVHHVIASIVPPESVDAYVQADAAEPGAGYTCFGGSAIRGADGKNIRVSMVGGWAPGSMGSEFAAGTGIRVLPGSKLVVQVHYNTSAAPPVADVSKLLLKVDDTVEREAFAFPFSDPRWSRERAMPIPFGESDVFHVFSYAMHDTASRMSQERLRSDAPLEIHAVNLHMHTRGTRASFTIERSGKEKACLLDIPRWNFHWQGFYQLARPVRLEPGDNLRIECHWNNAGFNDSHGLPVPAVKDLNWGEGTNDEMCVAFFYATQG